MLKNMTLHDTRLVGNPPKGIAQNTFQVDESKNIKNSLDWISSYAKSQAGLDNLFVLCHGGVATDGYEDRGGYGLQLCRENLTNENLFLTSCLKGQIKKITLFTCAIADTHPQNKNSKGDGKLFCRELAAYTDAEIIASPSVQMYNHIMTLFTSITNDLGLTKDPGEISFGSWEGGLYSFTPDGKVKSLS